MTDGWCAHCKTHVKRLQAHYAKCPVILRVVQLWEQTYFSLDVNIWPDPNEIHSPDVDVETVTQRLHEINSGEVRILQPTGFEFQVTKFQRDVVEYRRQLFADNDRIPLQERHFTQYAAIITGIHTVGLLFPSTAPGPVYVEFGAGRGYLAHFLSDLREDADVLLLERQAYRFKAERSLKGRSGSVSRLRIDIKDVVLSEVPQLVGRDFIGIGKHLCGAATDMALRACFTPRQKSLQHKRCAIGFAVATCCHHRCTWDSYVNRSYLAKLGFHRSCFSALVKISSWATLDASQVREVQDVGSANGLTWQNKRRLGCLAKDLIDTGRVKWAESLGWEGRLLTYIDSSISPESRLVLIYKSSSSTGDLIK